MGSRAPIIALLAIAASAQTPPLPEPASLIHQILAAQWKRDEARETYIYRWSYRTDLIDTTGRVHTTGDDEYDVFFIEAHEVRRLVKRDGVTLTRIEQQREDARLRNYAASDWLNPPLPPRITLASIGPILRGSTFSNPQTISLNRRDTLVLDFAPDSQADSQMTGTIWIDLADREIVRFEARNENRKFPRAIKLEQLRVEDGLWMVSTSKEDVALHAGGRKVTSCKSGNFRKLDLITLFAPKPPEGPR